MLCTSGNPNTRVSNPPPQRDVEDASATRGACSSHESVPQDTVDTGTRQRLPRVITKDANTSTDITFHELVASICASVRTVPTPAAIVPRGAGEAEDSAPRGAENRGRGHQVPTKEKYTSPGLNWHMLEAAMKPKIRFKNPQFIHVTSSGDCYHNNRDCDGLSRRPSQTRRRCSLRVVDEEP